MDNFTAPKAPTAAPDAWHGVESAPKDGTEILLYNKHKGRYIGWWREAESEDEISMWVGHCDPSLPTHWQPIPAAPQANQSTKEN